MKAGKILSVLAAAVAIGAVAYSIWLEPPAHSKAESLDTLRVNSLEQISLAIRQYNDQHDALPSDLKTVGEERNALRPQDWHDPSTGVSYEYKIFSPSTYQLCAIFVLDNETQTDRYTKKHHAGHDCFDYNVKAK
jgi:hypothetical protein